MKSAAAVGLVIGLTFLTGCGVSVEGPTAPAAPASAQPAVPSETAPAAPAASSSAPTDTSTALAENDPRRDRSFDMVMGCPAGEVVLDISQQNVLVNQDCKKITIAAPQVTVYAEHANSVVILVTGAQSEVTVRSADSVVIDASQADVHWESGTPAKVQTRGSQSHAGPVAG